MTTPDRRRVAVRCGLLIVAAGLLAAAGHFVAVTPPTPGSIYPKCVVHRLTGLHCPGCGTGRATHFLLRGRPLAAVRNNLFAPFVLPFVALLWGRAVCRWALGRPAPAGRLSRPLWPWLLVCALIGYTVLRNIPAEPFSSLAPQELDAAGEPTPRP